MILWGWLKYASPPVERSFSSMLRDASVGMELLGLLSRDRRRSSELGLSPSCYTKGKKTAKEDLHKEFRRDPGRGVKEGA